MTKCAWWSVITTRHRGKHFCSRSFWATNFFASKASRCIFISRCSRIKYVDSIIFRKEVRVCPCEENPTPITFPLHSRVLPPPGKTQITITITECKLKHCTSWFTHFCWVWDCVSIGLASNCSCVKNWQMWGMFGEHGKNQTEMFSSSPTEVFSSSPNEMFSIWAEVISGSLVLQLKCSGVLQLRCTLVLQLRSFIFKVLNVTVEKM